MIPGSDKGKKGRRPIDSLYSYNQVTFVGKQDSIPLETLRYCVEHILESSHPRVKGAGVSIHQLLSVTGGWRLLKGCPLSGLSAPPPCKPGMLQKALRESHVLTVGSFEHTQEDACREGAAIVNSVCYRDYQTLMPWELTF